MHRKSPQLMNSQEVALVAEFLLSPSRYLLPGQFFVDYPNHHHRPNK